MAEAQYFCFGALSMAMFSSLDHTPVVGELFSEIHMSSRCSSVRLSQRYSRACPQHQVSRVNVSVALNQEVQERSTQLRVGHRAAARSAIASRLIYREQAEHIDGFSRLNQVMVKTSIHGAFFVLLLSISCDRHKR